MPVEIKELVIRAIAAPSRSPVVAPEPTATAAAPPAPLGRDQREAIVRECVKRILRTLEVSRER